MHQGSGGDRAARQGDYANGCDILVRSLAFGTDDPDYPTEWVRIDDEPTCTAFLEDGGDEPDPPAPEPDPSQLVLIADPTEDIALAKGPPDTGFPIGAKADLIGATQ